ncbi:hypothetical protein H9P43_009495 [Blastocladiella emersonii ATCC 22665]|nr:hypothetical protein H9P43_009495 [Blastocladiella emersonii ATCC 22665]
MPRRSTRPVALLALLALLVASTSVNTVRAQASGHRFDAVVDPALGGGVTYRRDAPLTTASDPAGAGSSSWSSWLASVFSPPAAQTPVAVPRSSTAKRAGDDAPPGAISLELSSGAFKFKLQCLDVDDARCRKMGRALTTAGTIYSMLLRLETPVVVTASFKSFCVHPPTQPSASPGEFGNTASASAKECPDRLRNAVGSAFPSAQWNLFGIDGVDPRYTYPQALAKQVVPKPLAWSASDITAQFNVDADLWFEDDGAPIKPAQTDAVYVVVHELLHGMGLTTSWNAYAQSLNIANLPSTNFLSPHPSLVNDGTRVAGFLPHTVYDKFLYDTVHQRPLAFYAHVMATCTRDGTPVSAPPADFYGKFLTSRVGQYAYELYAAATTANGIVFVFPDPPRPDMESPSLVAGKPDGSAPAAAPADGSPAASGGSPASSGSASGGSGKAAAGNTASDGGTGAGQAGPGAAVPPPAASPSSSSSSASRASTATPTASAAPTASPSATPVPGRTNTTNPVARLVRRDAAPASAPPEHLVLHTPNTYALGSSLSHVVNLVPGGPNFLLRPFSQPGASLLTVTATNANTTVEVSGNATMADAFAKAKLSPVGLGVLRMLDALGYEVQPGFGLPDKRKVRREAADPEWREVSMTPVQCANAWWPAAK